MNIENFDSWLSTTTHKLGAISAACIRLDNKLLCEQILKNNQRYAQWLSDGKHGEMDYLRRMAPEKETLRAPFPRAKSVLVFTFKNRWGDLTANHPFPPPTDDAFIGYISAYAKEQDYHHTGQQLLAQFKIALEQRLGREIETDAAVDTKPVYERLLATFGGLGVRGGNDLLRVPHPNNTRVFIGCLFVDTELPEIIHTVDMPFACESCQACIKNCPTGALRLGEPIDARKCISYLTIEKRSVLSAKEEAMIGDWLFGCDDCTRVCPPPNNVDLRIPIDLEWLLKTPAGQLRKLIAGNATAYAGVTQLRKNAVIILKKRYSPAARELLDWVQQNTGSELIKKQLNQ